MGLENCSPCGNNYLLGHPQGRVYKYSKNGNSKLTLREQLEAKQLEAIKKGKGKASNFSHHCTFHEVENPDQPGSKIQYQTCQSGPLKYAGAFQGLQPVAKKPSETPKPQRSEPISYKDDTKPFSEEADNEVDCGCNMAAMCEEHYENIQSASIEESKKQGHKIAHLHELSFDPDCSDCVSFSASDSKKSSPFKGKKKSRKLTQG